MKTKPVIRAGQGEMHRSGRAGWLRAAVLGSDDANRIDREPHDWRRCILRTEGGPFWLPAWRALLQARCRWLWANMFR